MKPLKIEFEAFGPYVGHEEVDFETLSSRGLFLICGKTGIGKTMILDAMTFALYGKSSGNGRNDFEAMRCTKAPFEATTYVKFVFENNGDYYTFERRLERKRKNLSASYNLMKKDENGEWQTLLENPKDKELNSKAVEIIGLEYDQFRQVIVLPQGQFEKLLTSDSSEKEKILTSIFGEEKWAKIAENFYNEAEERKNELKGLKDRIERSLKDEGCEKISDLETIIESKKDEKKQLEEEFAKQDYEKVIADERENQKLISRFRELHNAECKLKELKNKADERVSWEKNLKEAKRAEAVRKCIDDVKVAAESLEQRRKQEASSIKATEEAEEQYKIAEDKLKSHTEKDAEIEQLRSKKTGYENKRQDYSGIDAAEKELNEKKAALKKAEAEEKKAKAKCDSLKEELARLNNEYIELNRIHSELFEKYNAGIVGEIAKQLKDGEACPVCGSKEHPVIAHFSEDSVTKQDVEESKKKVDSKFNESNKKEVDKNDADNNADEKHKIVEKAINEVSISETKLKGLKENLVEGIDSLEELNSEIAKLEKKIRDHIKENEKLNKELNQAREASATAKANIDNAKKETLDAEKKLEAAEKSLNEGLKANGFDSAEEAEKSMVGQSEIDAISNRITAYDTSLKSAEESLANISDELKGKTEPDEAESERRFNEALAKKSEYDSNKSRCESEIQKLSEKLMNLKAEGEGIEDKIREAEEDFTFAKRLRGDSGTGLQRYVLGIMFSSVVAAANKMLELVHGGRYRLFRSDDRSQGTNKKGLELKVFDNNSEEHDGRFVSTLSGGEKFLCSLALSIGMSTVAQKSGIRIEALFIDEGFGSLDDESINDAMSVLNSIQEANGLVGIISHVQILQDQIPSKLRIVEKDGGSHIVQTIG